MDNVKIFVLPGGALPQRQTSGAIGYDVRLRALVSAHDMDPAMPDLRKTIFDFVRMPTDISIAAQVVEHGGSLKYRLEQGASVLGGIGFLTEMEFPMYYWIAPRSGLASKWGITVTNAPGTVDPDYRGEAGVSICNRGDSACLLSQNMRIAQIIFQKALIPELLCVEAVTDLSASRRGADGFGSTGVA